MQPEIAAAARKYRYVLRRGQFIWTARLQASDVDLAGLTDKQFAAALIERTTESAHQPVRLSVTA